MNAPKWIVCLFIIAALYDGVLGLLFLAAPTAAFEWCQVEPPNHVGYVQFPAALLLIFALMFASIAQQPVARRHLIFFGILLKVAYCSVAGLHWASGGIPGMWKPFCVADAIFLVLFAWAWVALRTGNRALRRPNTEKDKPRDPPDR